MSLNVGALIPNFTLACKSYDPVFGGYAFATNIAIGLDVYMRDCENIGKIWLQPFGFMFWQTPILNLLLAVGTPNVSGAIFGMKVGLAIDFAFMSIFTHYQTSINYTGFGSIAAKFSAIFDSYNITSDIVPIQMAEAVHAAAKSILLTIWIEKDNKQWYSPLL